MERLGKVSEWNDDRGFGFIAPLDGEPARVFFHIRDYRLDSRRPEVGELVKFNAQRQPDGKWRAQAVHRTVASARKTKPAASVRTGMPRPETALPGALATAAYAAVLAWAISNDRLPFETMFVVLGLSAITYVVYPLDKYKAQTGRWRTPESALHLLEFAGGWPGAWIAQQTLRHKSRKRGYRIAFWMMVALHCAALAAWLGTRT
jgi:uncharacterized membrane protein YsdA (DUF1294 family)/cold shock CspA family protein